MQNKKYTIENKETKDKKVAIILNENSGFEGVKIEFVDIKLLPEKNESGHNCQITYDIIEIPEGKYKDLDDIKKDEFEKLIEEVFVDILTEAIPKIENKEIELTDKESAKV
jgi:hypothetical protein